MTQVDFSRVRNAETYRAWSGSYRLMIQDIPNLILGRWAMRLFTGDEWNDSTPYSISRTLHNDDQK